MCTLDQVADFRSARGPGRKQFLDEHGREVGWFDGEVLKVLSSSQRKCVYVKDGFEENLSVAQLKLLAQKES